MLARLVVPHLLARDAGAVARPHALEVGPHDLFRREATLARAVAARLGTTVAAVPAAPARASARASLLALSARSARCMHGFLPMWLMGDQPNRSCMLKYEYMRAMGSRSVSTMRIVGAAA